MTRPFRRGTKLSETRDGQPDRSISISYQMLHASSWRLSLIGCIIHYRRLFGPEPLGGRLSSLSSYYCPATIFAIIGLTAEK